MLMRISLIVALLAGLAVGVLNFVKVKEKITTVIGERESEKTQKVAAQKELASTKQELTKTTAELNQTKTTLEATTAERDKAVTAVADLTKRTEGLTADLTKARQERDAAQSDLAAYTATGFKPEQLTSINKQIKELESTVANTESENKILLGRIRKLDNELAVYRPGSPPVALPQGLTGKVITADPKWNFVVINVGEDQGILQRGELLVNRNGRLVAKVVVSSVQKNRCVANVMPGWQLGEVLEGDQVIPAHPAS